MCGEASGTYKKKGRPARASAARWPMYSTDLCVIVGSTWAASNPGAVGPVRVRRCGVRSCIIGKSRSSVGSDATRSFSMNTYGTMSSDVPCRSSSQNRHCSGRSQSVVRSRR